MTSLLAQHGATLVANGYSVIPIKPGDKAPGKWDTLAQRWVDLAGWQRFCDRVPTEIELDSWQDWPDAGAGMPTGAIVGLDIDVEDDELAHRIDAMTREVLGDTPLTRYGFRPKRVLVYRAAEPFSSFDVVAGDRSAQLGTKPLQALATGRQFVAFGIHPRTGQPYDWPEESPLSVDIGDLPVVTQDQVRDWATRAAKILGIVWPPVERSDRVLADKELATREAIEQALSFVPIDSCRTREEWLSIGMAIHAGLGGDGVELWDAWSAGTNQVKADGSSAYDGKKLLAQWQAFNRSGPGAIGPGTLFDRARSFGWKPNGVCLYQHEADAVAAAPALDLGAFVAAVDARNGTVPVKVAVAPVPASPIPSTPVPRMPNWRKNLTGGLAQFVDYADQTSVSPQPWIALAAGLAAFGVLAGRRYAGPSGVRTNIYTVGIAESSGGKDYPLKVLKRLLDDAGMNRMIGGSKIASGSGMITALEKQPSTIFPTDEIGFLMQAVADRKRAPKHAAEIIDNLTEFFTSSEDTFHGTAYANQKEKPRVAIVQPNLCLFGVTTPQVFWGALSSAHVLDGSLARMLIFETPEHFPDRRRRTTGPRPPIPTTLVDIAKQIAAGAEGHEALPFGDASDQLPNPYPVPFADQAAEDRHYDIEGYGVDLCKLHQGTAKTAIYGRLAENTFKVALIRAIADNPLAPEVTRDDLDWAFDVVEHSVNTVLRAIEQRVSDNQDEANLKRILRLIVEAGSAGMTHEELGRACGFMGGRRRLQEAIDHLTDSEQVVLHSFAREGGGRPRRVYMPG